MNREYSASTTNARPTYSQLDRYGTNTTKKGIYDGKIYPPVPVSILPKIFYNIKPHSIKQPTAHRTNGCYGFKNLNQKCHS